MTKTEVKTQLTKLGFPTRNCRCVCQLTQANSLLMKKLGYDSQPWTCDVIAIEDRGLVTGLRSQRGHKSLTEWDKIVSVE